MSHRSVLSSARLQPWLLALAPFALRCVEDTESPAKDADGTVTAPEPGGAAGQGGESFGPTLICGKRTLISDCDPVSGEPCAVGTTCEHFIEFGGFRCTDRPDAAGPGEPCDDETIQCGIGLYCDTDLTFVCQHYCCESSDCTEYDCWGGYYQDGEATIGYCFDEYGGRCALAEIEGEELDECQGGASGSIDTAGGSAP
jgi:hypothetical protein